VGIELFDERARTLPALSASATQEALPLTELARLNHNWTLLCVNGTVDLSLSYPHRFIFCLIHPLPPQTIRPLHHNYTIFRITSAFQNPDPNGSSLLPSPYVRRIFPASLLRTQPSPTNYQSNPLRQHRHNWKHVKPRDLLPRTSQKITGNPNKGTCVTTANAFCPAIPKRRRHPLRLSSFVDYHGPSQFFTLLRQIASLVRLFQLTVKCIARCRYLPPLHVPAFHITPNCHTELLVPS